jgi:hypothetical protein
MKDYVEFAFFGSSGKVLNPLPDGVKLSFWLQMLPF